MLQLLSCFYTSQSSVLNCVTAFIQQLIFIIILHLCCHFLLNVFIIMLDWYEMIQEQFTD